MSTPVAPAEEWRRLFPKQAAALEAANAHHRRGQAYLFTGSSLEPMILFARGWAQTAACLSPTPQGAACGHCRNCQLFRNNAYSEFFTVAPESKISTIRVEKIREFNQDMALSTPDGMLKFGMVVQADAMMPESANAFLKTLEEPSPQVMFLLLTTRPQALLPTIRSRCQTLLLPSNQRDYGQLVPREFLEILGRLHRGAGAKVALNASRELLLLFGQLKEQAAENTKGGFDPELEEQAKKDKTLRDEMKKRQEAREATEYAKLLGNYLETLQSWFYQRFLMASGIPRERLPQQEFLPFLPPDTPAPSLLEAQEDLKLVEQLRRALHAKVPEDLCLDAFTLPLCEIPPRQP
ncbi:MAG: hypothetical protein ACI4SG_09030 [Oligosphaeraceae bacterium]